MNIYRCTAAVTGLLISSQIYISLYHLAANSQIISHFPVPVNSSTFRSRYVVQ